MGILDKAKVLAKRKKFFFTANINGKETKMHVQNKFVVRNNGPKKQPSIMNAHDSDNKPKVIYLNYMTNGKIALRIYDELVKQVGSPATVPLIFNRVGKTEVEINFNDLDGRYSL